MNPETPKSPNHETLYAHLLLLLDGQPRDDVVKAIDRYLRGIGHVSVPTGAAVSKYPLQSELQAMQGDTNHLLGRIIETIRALDIYTLR